MGLGRARTQGSGGGGCSQEAGVQEAAAPWSGWGPEGGSPKAARGWGQEAAALRDAGSPMGRKPLGELGVHGAAVAWGGGRVRGGCGSGSPFRDGGGEISGLRVDRWQEGSGGRGAILSVQELLHSN